MSVDGSAFTNYQSPIIFSDGVHSYQFRATDNAGNLTESGQTLNVDATTPALNLTTTGTTGLNGWYRSSAQLTALGTDSTSGAAKIEVSTDGGAFLPYTTPVTVNDGQHSYQFKLTDNAGNVTQSTKAVKVDTVTPSLSLNLSGTRGQNDWYVSSTSVTPSAADATSGIATLEISQDNSQFINYQPFDGLRTASPIIFSDGLHSYQFRATDNAGNVTETPVQNLKVDTIAPVIEMDDELKLGEYLYYDLEDPRMAEQAGSGLWIVRTVIEDDDEKFSKIAWEYYLNREKFSDEILWDGKFADRTQAPFGSYFITLKVSDAAGNERMRTAIVKVGLLSFLDEIPAFAPPASASAPLPAQTAQTASAAVTEFGGTNSGATGETTSESASAGGANNGAASAESASISAGGTAVLNNETEYVKSGFTQGNETTSTPITNSNILWGAAATAMLGATLADWQRRREEEEARKRAEAAAQEEGGRGGKKTPGQRAYEKMMKQKRIVGASQALLDEKRSAYTPNQKLEEEETNWLKKLNPVYQYEKRKEEAKQKAELQAGLSAYYEGRKKGEEQPASTPQPSLLSNLWNAGVSALGSALSPAKVFAPKTVANQQSLSGTLSPWILLIVGVSIIGGVVLYYHDRGAKFVLKDDIQSSIENVANQKGISSIEIAAGISVQYHYNGFPLETLFVNPIQALQCRFDVDKCSHSSTGPAQLTSEEYFSGEDPNDINVAAIGMANRITEIKGICEKGRYKGECSSVDIEIAIAMAQNGSGFTPENFAQALSLPSLPNGNINWTAYFDSRSQDNLYTKFLTIVRGQGRDYSTQYMVDLYTAELRKLYDGGYPLPDGISECDLDYMEDLSNGLAPTPCD